MAFELTATNTALCNSLIQKYRSLLDPLEKIKNDYRSQLNKFESKLHHIIFSTSGEIASGLQNIESKTKASIPEDTIDAVREIKSFVDGCDCFFEGESAENAVSAIMGSLLGIYDQIDDYIGQITYPEFEVGAIASKLNELISGKGPHGGGVALSLKKADCLANCITALCPATAISSEFQDLLDQTQEYYDIFKLEDDPTNPNYGTIKYNDIYSSVGLSASEISNMENVISGIDSIKSEAFDSIGKSVSSIKNAIKGGLF